MLCNLYRNTKFGSRGKCNLYRNTEFGSRGECEFFYNCSYFKVNMNCPHRLDLEVSMNCTESQLDLVQSGSGDE